MHHITSDLGTLSLHAPYHGFDNVQVGNGQELSISNNGTVILHTPLSRVHFCNVLHRPQASTDVLSIPQLSRDNHCYFCFDDNGFYVKDKI